MLYRKMGKPGTQVSALGFGCMRLPVKDGKYHCIDVDKATTLIEYAISHGVNYFDTAYPYHAETPIQPGMSEVFLGEALKSCRDKVKLATKLPSWLIKTRADMDFYLNDQLKRLQTDYIDFYLLHGLHGDYWQNLHRLGVIDFLSEALADGRIRNAGFSFHDAFPLFKEIVDCYDWSFCQIQYNYMDENFQAGRQGLEYAAAKGLGVVVMEPLRGGNLAKRLPEDILRIWRKAGIKRSPAEWGLRFVWNRPEVSVVLSGMNMAGQVAENIATATEARPDSLTPEELHLIGEVRDIYRQKVKVDCTGCRYCMPCPNGVNIPDCFSYLNNAAMYDDLKSARFSYNIHIKEHYRASRCIQCGKCEQACPQHIPIAEKLKEVVDAFGS